MQDIMKAFVTNKPEYFDAVFGYLTQNNQFPPPGFLTEYEMSRLEFTIYGNFKYL